MNESLKSCIKALPPLPESVAQIQRVCSLPDASLADLAAVVEKDPMITANLLKAANSPFYGFSGEIKSVKQAVSLFGMATVKGLALSGAIKQVVKIDMSPYGFTPNAFASISQAQNAFIVNWFNAIDRVLLDILSPASFLQLTGAILVAGEIINQKKSAEFSALLGQTQYVCEAEMQIVGSSTPIVTAEIFEHWRFDRLMIAAIRASIEPSSAEEENVKIMAGALAVARTLVPLKKQESEKSLEEALALGASLGFDLAPLTKASEDIIKKTTL